MTAPRLTDAQRRRVLVKLVEAIDLGIARHTDPRLPRYPSGVPDLDRHLDKLVANISQTIGLSPDARASQLVQHICGDCPHQFPQRYCPLGGIGGCVPRRFAPQIVRHITELLPELEPSNRMREDHQGP